MATSNSVTRERAVEIAYRVAGVDITNIVSVANEIDNFITNGAPAEEKKQDGSV